MRKFFSVGFATLGALILIFVIVFTSMELVINDETFLNNEFTKLNIGTSMKMSNFDLVRSTTRLVDYMQGEVDDINVEVTVNGETVQMFEIEQEVTHMKDVREIYLGIKEYRDTGVLVMLVLFLFSALIFFRKAPQMLAQGYLSGAFIALLVFGFLGTWAAMDFSSFWTFFHQMLFWNDLWLFDAAQSRMINMLPETLFADMVGQIFLYAGIVLAALIGLSVLCLVLSSEAHKKKQIEARKRKKARLAATQARKKAKAQAKAEKEKAKRLAAKKAHKAAVQKQRAKAQAEKEKARAKAARAAGRKGGSVTGTGRTAQPRPDEDYYDDDDVSYGPEATAELSEGYAADFFQSKTYADYQADALSTTTTGGIYPEAPTADFFKNYAAAAGMTGQPGQTVSESDDPLYANAVYGEATYGEISYVDQPMEPVRPDDRRSQRPNPAKDGQPSTTGRQAAGKKSAKAPAKKKAAAKTSKKGANIQDDMGFFDD